MRSHGLQRDDSGKLDDFATSVHSRLRNLSDIKFVILDLINKAQNFLTIWFLSFHRQVFLNRRGINNVSVDIVRILVFLRTLEAASFLTHVFRFSECFCAQHSLPDFQLR